LSTCWPDAGQTVQSLSRALSVSISEHVPRLISLLHDVRSTYPELPVWIGGQAFRHGGRDEIESFPNVKLITGMDELERLLAA